MNDELRALLALQLVPGLGPMRTKALLETFHSAQAVLRASRAQLAQIAGIGEKLSADIGSALAAADIEAELSLIEKHRASLRVLGHEDYPASLAEISDAPYLLYVRGTILPEDARAVALVGSRHCTAYGKRVAERLALGLAKAGYVVVSGLARGIDGAAHRGALQGGGRTLAVLAGGLSRIYPPEHVALADEVEKSGALITESSMRQEPIAGLFPARNRIISGLCKAVVLVEAAEKSGALITARHAAEQGRTVLAVPGAIDSDSSSGTNALIRQGAILCRSVEDILEEVEGVSNRILAESSALPFKAPPPPDLDETQRRVWDFLEPGPKHIDEMVQQLGLGAAPLAGILLTMEMKKCIRRLPGSRFERC